MRQIFGFLFLFLAFSTSAQNLNLEGHWFLSTIRSTAPEMDMANNELIYQDSSQSSPIFVEPGLMLLSILPNGKAESYFADVKENWDFSEKSGKVKFVSPADTLIGDLSHFKNLELQSTIEEGYTVYSFTKYNPEPINLNLENSAWKVSGEVEALNSKTFKFGANNQLTIEQNGESQKMEYFIHKLNNYYALEFTSPDLPAEYGIVYFEKATDNTLTGIIMVGYMSQEVQVPFSKYQITFTKK